MMILYQKFFEAALLVFMAARALTERAHYPPALYHLQQAYEKCIKSYFIFKELNIKKTSEAVAYQCIQKLGHDTQESTIALLKDMANIERQVYTEDLLQ